MEEKISFGTWLRKQRRLLDLTRQAFADQVGCAEVTLRRIESGTLKPSKELANIVIEKLGISETERAQWISFARGLSEFPQQSIPSSSKPITNLPAPLTSFIGREKEQSEVIMLISKYRLVTLTGSGGVGKTRLSIRVGEQVLRNYPDGVYIVELAPILDPLLVPRTTAAIIGLRDESELSAVDLLCNYLHDKRMLIILDNCEHLIDTCAHFIFTLLSRCSHLEILVTSREPLGTTGEAIYRVPSFSVPNVQQLPDTSREFAFVRLFEERAQLVQFDFSWSLDNASAIAQICQRLDGIPLAIELAAAKVGMLSTEQIVKQLDESFNILTGGSRTALLHHQTLRASMNWSWGLLTKSEQILMRQLSVFTGGWTLDAAQSVCDGDVLYQINSLVAKSLIVMDQEKERVRYRFHETIRQYAYEKLSETQEGETIRDQHLKYFLELSEQIEQELVGAQQSEWFVLTHYENNNLRAALKHAYQTDVEAGLYISGRLKSFWEDFDMREGIRWLAEFIQKPESKEYPLAKAKALYAKGWFLYRFHQFETAQSAAEECLALCRSVGDRHGEVDALSLLGFLVDTPKSTHLIHQAITLAQSLGDLRRQAMALSVLGWGYSDNKRFSYWEEAVALYRQAGDWRSLAKNLSQLGLFLLMDGQLDAAQKRLDEASLLFQQLNIHTISHLFSGFGQLALIRGHYEQARAYFQEDARVSNELGSRVHYLWATCRLGFAELYAGNRTKARQIFDETVQSFQKDGNNGGVIFTLEGMSSLYIALDKADVAARLIGWTDATREMVSDTRPKLEQADVDKIIAACIIKMGEAAFSDAYDEGQKMTLDEAVAFALQDH